jgi:hypothetical protein
MPSTNTSNLNLEKPADGEQSGEWGDTINSNMELIDAAVATKTGSETLTNKTLTSPVLATGVSGTAIKDEDDMASNSASHLATQQSIKAYVDTQIATEDTLAELNDTSISSPAAGHLVIYDNTASRWENATLTAGSNVSITNGDGAVTIASTDTNTQLSPEQVEDFVGGMLDGTETFIAVSYDDVDGNIDFVVPVKDEDDMASNSATFLATQQSIKAYVDATAGSPAADNIATGDAAVSIATTVGNITIDAQANDADVIIKVDDAGASVTAVTFDGSDEGNATFVNDVKLGSDASVIGFGVNNDVTLTHVHDTGLSLSAGANITQLEVISTDAGATAGPLLTLSRDSATPAVSDALGQVIFIGKNDADPAEDVVYSSITASILDETDGTEDGQLTLNVMRAGTLTNAIALKENEVELNAATIDINGDVEIASTYTLNVSNIGTDNLFKAAGNVMMGRDSSATYATTDGRGLYTYYDASNYTRVLTYTTSDGSPVWQSRSGGVIKSEIESNGDFQSATESWLGVSDERLKENIIDSPSQWDDVKAMRIRKYSFISDNLDSPNMLGVIAQELEASGMGGLVKTKPYMDPPADGVGPDVPVLDADGNPTDYKVVKSSVLRMKAVKALQEAMERIETLEAKVTALENA